MALLQNLQGIDKQSPHSLAAFLLWIAKNFNQPAIFFLFQTFCYSLLIIRCQNNFGENGIYRTCRFHIESLIENHDITKWGNRIRCKCAVVSFVERGSDCDPTRDRMLEDSSSRNIRAQVSHQLQGTVDIQVVVVTQLLAMETVDIVALLSIDRGWLMGIFTISQRSG